MVKMTGAKAIAKTLKEHAIEYVFYIPGYGVDACISEIEAENINVVLTRNEKCAAYMADGYARIGLRPGVCFGYRGPGSLNLAAGLADAYWSSSPVIALTSATQKSHLHKDSYQGIPDIRHFDEITKWNVSVVSSKVAGDVLRSAFQVATSGCPGPVHVNFHADAIFEEMETPEPYGNLAYHKIPAKRQKPNHEDVEAVAKVLIKAERPVIVTGQGVLISQAWDEVIQLAEMLMIPIATSNTGKGIIPDKHPLAIGVSGLYSKATANKMILDSDLVFFIGCKTGNMATGNWTIPKPDTKVIQLDIDPEFIARNYRISASMVCDAKLGLKDLIMTLKQVMVRPRKVNQTRLREVEKIMRKWNEIVDSELESDVIPIKGARLIKEIRNALSADDILVVDTGSETIWSSLFFEVYESGRNYLCAAGSLGWSFPATIGVKLAVGDKRVLNLIGDGGIGYHISEIETALRYDVPFVAVVLNNQSWSNPSGTANVNFGKIAEGFDAFGIRVERPGDIAGALEEAFKSGKPSIVDVLMDSKETGYSALDNSRLWIAGAPTNLPFL